jgi:hypothetical protein
MDWQSIDREEQQSGAATGDGHSFGESQQGRGGKPT